jgi:hypothetical protein
MYVYQHDVGLGDPSSVFNVYIDKRPAFQQLVSLNACQPLLSEEIKAIGSACGNGWRKVFNVYAKLVYALVSSSNLSQLSSSSVVSVVSKRLSAQHINNWQDLRDKKLLRDHSATALLFSKPCFEANDKIHLVMGRNYALSLNLPDTLIWLDREFAIDHAKQLIVCPYFDYRQLSNIKIIRLVELIQSLIVNEQACLSEHFS